MVRDTGAASRGRSRRASAFFYGVAHALDLGGLLARNRGRFGAGLRGDAIALNHDWRVALGRASGWAGNGHGEG